MNGAGIFFILGAFLFAIGGWCLFIFLINKFIIKQERANILTWYWFKWCCLTGSCFMISATAVAYLT